VSAASEPRSPDREWSSRAHPGATPRLENTLVCRAVRAPLRHFATACGRAWASPHSRRRMVHFRLAKERRCVSGRPRTAGTLRAEFASDRPASVDQVILGSAFDIAALVMATSVSAAALAVIGVVAKRLSLPPWSSQTASAGTQHDVFSDASAAGTPVVERVSTVIDDLAGDGLLSRYYVDRVTLDSLATDLGIPIDAVHVEEAFVSESATDIGAQISTSLDIPSVAGIHASLGGQAKQTDYLSQTRSLQRRARDRELLHGICAALYGRDHLTIDTLSFPTDTNIEAFPSSVEALAARRELDRP